MTNQQIEAAVSHPLHYNRGSVEVWDFIIDHRLDYLRGNAVKYICRAGFKDDREQDLRKALAYLAKAATDNIYPRETHWEDHAPKIDPVSFAQDQQLEPPLAAALVMVCQWDIGGAIHFVNQAVDNLKVDQKPKPKTTVYGKDDERFADNRKDTRAFEFGKRMGIGR